MARRGYKDAPEETKNELSYLQPEILPIQVMSDVLMERGVKSSVLQQSDRSIIVRLFHKHVCPKHQRDHRENRRGKLMMRMRRKREKTSGDEDWKKLVMDSKERKLPTSSSSPLDSPGGERLKPPPSCINMERKTIKLGGSVKSPDWSLESVVVKRQNSDEGEHSSNGKVRRLSSDGENSVKNKRPSSDGEKSVDNKKNDGETSLDNKKVDGETSLDNKKADGETSLDNKKADGETSLDNKRKTEDGHRENVKKIKKEEESEENGKQNKLARKPISWP